MRINIWIVLAVLLALLATTRLLQYQHETQRMRLGVRAVSFALNARRSAPCLICALG